VCGLAVADATYVYTHTKSKPEGRTRLGKVLVGRLQCHRSAITSFDHAVGIVAGAELAKEWANRPANHATPTHVGAGQRKNWPNCQKSPARC
jgi:leucyl aminopeptidase